MGISDTCLQTGQAQPDTHGYMVSVNAIAILYCLIPWLVFSLTNHLFNIL